MTGVIFSLWIGLGAIIHGKSPIEDDLPVGQCLDRNTTVFNDTIFDEEYFRESSIMLNQTVITNDGEAR